MGFFGFLVCEFFDRDSSLLAAAGADADDAGTTVVDNEVVDELAMAEADVVVEDVLGIVDVAVGGTVEEAGSGAGRI